MRCGVSAGWGITRTGRGAGPIAAAGTEKGAPLSRSSFYGSRLELGYDRATPAHDHSSSADQTGAEQNEAVGLGCGGQDASEVALVRRPIGSEGEGGAG